MRCSRPAAIVLLLSQVIAASALAGDRKPPHAAAPAACGNSLDRVAFAVDGAEFEPRRRRGDVARQPDRAAGADAGQRGRGERCRRRRSLRHRAKSRRSAAPIWRCSTTVTAIGPTRSPPIIGASAISTPGSRRGGRPNGRRSGVVAYLGRVLHDSGICAGRPATPAAASGRFVSIAPISAPGRTPSAMPDTCSAAGRRVSRSARQGHAARRAACRELLSRSLARP